MRTGPVAIALALAAGCGGGVEPIRSCEAERGIEPVCGFRNPEDLVAVAGSDRLLVSQMGRMDGSETGSLARFDPATGAIEVLYPGGAEAAEPGWGDDACPGPPGATLSPHGIDLGPRPDGRLRLLVVNHGGRETVELFEVALGAAGPELVWRGCAVPPEGAFLNDVAALADGGFVATHMYPKGAGVRQVYHFMRGALGFDTGHALEWHPGAGFAPVPGTEGAMPNGIAVSPDGRRLFVNLYIGGEVRRVARDGSEPPASAEVRRPDNATWSRDGRLLVASHSASTAENLGCSGIESGACPARFEIVAIDPDTMESQVVFENAGPPMGAGTVALHVGDWIYIGSFAGDRVIRAPLER